MFIPWQFHSKKSNLITTVYEVCFIMVEMHSVISVRQVFLKVRACFFWFVWIFLCEIKLVDNFLCPSFMCECFLNQGSL